MRRFAEPRGNSGLAAVADMQAHLGAPPQHIVGRRCPFVADIVIELGFEHATDVGAKAVGEELFRRRADRDRQTLDKLWIIVAFERSEIGQPALEGVLSGFA